MSRKYLHKRCLIKYSSVLANVLYTPSLVSCCMPDALLVIHRADNNAKVVDLLKENFAMWDHVHGIAPERLFRPAATDIELAKQGSSRLSQCAESDGRDGIVQFAEEVAKGVEMLASLEWEDSKIMRMLTALPNICLPCLAYLIVSLGHPYREVLFDAACGVL